MLLRLGVARARFEDQLPEPQRLVVVPALFGQQGEAAQSEVAVDALIPIPVERNSFRWYF